VWFWLVAGSADLTTEARFAIDEAAAAGTLRIAAISLWEVAMLAARGRIVLGKSIGLWLEEALAANRGRKLCFTRRISSRPS